MTPTALPSPRRGKLLLMGIVVAAAAMAFLAYATYRTFRPTETRPLVHHVCESCEHEWDDSLGIAPSCPQCGAKPLLKTWFRCPKCGHVWVGLDRRKLGPGKFQYRLPDTDAWLDASPEKLTCPGCSYTSHDLYRRALPGGPGGKPPATVPAEGDHE